MLTIETTIAPLAERVRVSVTRDRLQPIVQVTDPYTGHVVICTDEYDIEEAERRCLALLDKIEKEQLCPF